MNKQHCRIYQNASLRSYIVLRRLTALGHGGEPSEMFVRKRMQNMKQIQHWEIFGKASFHLTKTSGARILKSIKMIPFPSLSDTLIAPPTTALPEISEETWAQWNAVFDSLDRDGDDQIVVEDLVKSGLLSETMCWRSLIGAPF